MKAEGAEDSFALVWMKDRLYGLNSSGYSPKNISMEEVKAKSPDGRMPKYGWTPVMVPGAVKAWPTLVKRFGKLSLKEDLEPAIRYAEEGYPVGVLLGEMWERSTAQYHQRLDNGVVPYGSLHLRRRVCDAADDSERGH